MGFRMFSHRGAFARGATVENGFLAANKDLAVTAGLVHQSTGFDGRRPGANDRNGLVSKLAIIRYIEGMPHAVRIQLSQYIGDPSQSRKTGANDHLAREQTFARRQSQFKSISPRADIRDHHFFQVGNKLVLNLEAIGSEALHRTRFEILKPMLPAPFGI